MARETIDFGIDLGTSNSSIAVVNDQRAEIIRNNDNDELTPSVVRYLPSGAVQVGRAAYQHLRVPGAEESTFSRFKRQMGQ
jgi:molecular chaperone DnaK